MGLSALRQLGRKHAAMAPQGVPVRGSRRQASPRRRDVSDRRVGEPGLRVVEARATAHFFHPPRHRMPRMGRINTPLDPLYPAPVLGFLTAGITLCLWHVGAQAETGLFSYISIWQSQLYALLGGRR
jgi:hypothetical protein